MRHLKDSERYTALGFDLDTCALCGRPREHLHEVFFGTANRQKSKDYGMVMPLCARCHDMVHRDPALRLKTQQFAQRKFEEKHTHEEFMSIWRRNYL
jgi:hypothetical protein